jgi:hypothetical protein
LAVHNGEREVLVQSQGDDLAEHLVQFPTRKNGPAISP